MAIWIGDLGIIVNGKYLYLLQIIGESIINPLI